jgi:ABC-2 type transport system permease protein
VSLWRLEWLRLVRTKRWMALVAVYVFFGLLGPFTARYLGDILDRLGGDLEGATIVLPDPEPVDGLVQFAANASQLGLLVAIVIAAGALTMDARPEIAVFLRTRTEHVRTLLWPRFVVSAVAVAAAFVLGAFVAWYESVVLLGALPAGSVLAGIAYGVLYLVFAVAVIAAAAGRATSVLGAVLIAVVVLLLLPIVGIVDPIGEWLPSHLVGGLAAIPDGESAAGFLPAAGVTVAATAAAWALAVRTAGAREL